MVVAMIAIGIDPGLTGALCAISSQHGLLDCVDLPTCPNGTAGGSMKRWIDAEALDEVLRGWSQRFDFAREAVHPFVERPIPMPTLPAQTIASQFDTFGVVRALLAARYWSRETVFLNPRDWKPFFGLKADKNESRACCLRLYPAAPVSRVKDHNRAEAVLIGNWYRKVKAA